MAESASKRLEAKAFRITAKSPDASAVSHVAVAFIFSNNRALSVRALSVACSTDRPSQPEKLWRRAHATLEYISLGIASLCAAAAGDI